MQGGKRGVCYTVGGTSYLRQTGGPGREEKNSESQSSGEMRERGTAGSLLKRKRKHGLLLCSGEARKECPGKGEESKSGPKKTPGGPRMYRQGVSRVPSGTSGNLKFRKDPRGWVRREGKPRKNA